MSGDNFVSSIFSRNPDIPQLQLADVQQHKEEVFSSCDFSSFGIHPFMGKNLNGLGMSRLTLVQARAIPVLLAGKDALVKSQTGSGKTLAYAIPLMQRLQEIRPKLNRADGTLALVIVPTRELAIQSLEWFQKLCHSFAWVVPGTLIGGEKKKAEKARVRKGITVLISTPGRLLDHIEHTRCLSLRRVRWLVLDEADRMLELGYERDVQRILTALDEQGAPAAAPEDTHADHVGDISATAARANDPTDLAATAGRRQTVLLSATLTSGIEQLSQVALRHPTFVDAADGEDGKRETTTMKTIVTPQQLKQAFTIVPAKLRLVTLAAFILWKCCLSKSARKMLIFLATQDMVDFHLELFARCLTRGTKAAAEDDGFKLLKLHGSMKQKDRLDVFRDFRAATTGALLCTDVAARGLHLPKVDWIVQYTPATSTADYVHRVGRTARLGAKGSSLLFVLPSEAGFVKRLETNRFALTELPLQRIIARLHDGAGSEGHQRFLDPAATAEEAATNLQMKMENAVAEDESLHTSASEAYVSFVRSYASYPKESRTIFCFKDLHLGHIAKSYALRDPPTKITGCGKGNWVRKEERRKSDKLKLEEKVIKAQKKRINQKSLIMSEFSAGFEGASFEGISTKKKKGTRK